MKLTKFTSREQIIAKIDSVKATMELKSKQATQFGLEADELYAQSAKETDSGKIGTCIKNAGIARFNEKKLLKHLRGYPDKLARLKRTLAAFDTQPMEFADDAVVLQK